MGRRGEQRKKKVLTAEKTRKWFKREGERIRRRGKRRNKTKKERSKTDNINNYPSINNKWKLAKPLEG